MLIDMLPEHHALRPILAKTQDVSDALTRRVFEKFGGFVVVDLQHASCELNSCLVCNRVVALPRHDDNDTRLTATLTKTECRTVSRAADCVLADCGRHVFCNTHSSATCLVCRDWEDDVSESQPKEKLADVDYYTAATQLIIDCLREVFEQKAITLDKASHVRGRRIVVIDGDVSERCKRNNDVINL